MQLPVRTEPNTTYVQKRIEYKYNTNKVITAKIYGASCCHHLCHHPCCVHTKILNSFRDIADVLTLLVVVLIAVIMAGLTTNNSTLYYSPSPSSVVVDCYI